MSCASCLSPILRAVFRASLPRTNGLFDAPLEQAGQADVSRDEHGVPHIRAASERDLWFLNGVVHAQDRLWQMHSMRMLGSGRLCEFSGAKVLELDKLFRRLGFRRIAAQDLEEYRRAAPTDPDAAATLAMLEAYTDGVNWAATTSFKMMPLEFWLTGQRRIAPFEVVDFLLLVRVMAFSLSYGFQHTLLRSTLIEIFGVDRAAAWTDTAETEARIPHMVSGSVLAAFRKAKLSGALGRAVSAFPRGQGSNWWVVHGSRTTTGKPILVNDTHMMLQVPCFWYEVHLRLVPGPAGGPALSGYGVAPPGLPGVLAGHNSFCAVGVTLAFMDSEDLFLERFRKSDGRYLHMGQWHACEEHWEDIAVRGGGAVRCRCRKTCHGVVLEGSSFMSYEPFARGACGGTGGGAGEEEGEEVELALAATYLRPALVHRSCRALLAARSFAEFDASVAHCSRIFNLTLAYADAEGHIGLVVAGEVPQRRGARGAELLPMVGWTGEHDWLGFLPHAQLPKAYDPPGGVLISANHKIVSYDKYPHYLGAVWKSGYRALAISEKLRELSRGGGKISPQQMPAVMMDVRSWAAVEFVTELHSLTPDPDTGDALAMLLGWDGTMDAESVPASLYQLTHSELVRSLLRAGCEAVGPGRMARGSGGVEQDLLFTFVGGLAFDSSGVLKMVNEMQGHLHLNVLRILRSTGGGRHWWLEQAGGKDAAVNAALRAAVARLVEVAGADWKTSAKAQWSSFHVCHIRHTVSKALGLPPGSPPFDLPSHPVPGDTNTIRQAMPRSITDLTATGSGVVHRQMFDLSDLSSEATNRVVSLTGQSGQFNSRHYGDQNRLWRRGELHPALVSEARIRASAQEVMRFRRAKH